jgi:hypothetical protein
MKVLFTRWCVDPKGRTPVAVEPKRVDCVEFFSEAFFHGATGERFEAAAKIIMQGKQEYLVEGSVEAVTASLNGEAP